MEKQYFVLAYYKFVEVPDAKKEVREHKAFLKDRDATCRVYISEEGINGQFSAYKDDAEAYMEWLRTKPYFADVEFKIHLHHEQAFPRQAIKYREQLVALDHKVDMSLGGEHVSPKEWSRMIEEEQDKILIDVRNNYEWKIGQFEGSELPDLETFREFPEYARDLKKRVDPKKTKVMMCCTGGIRCELYSALMKEEGFDNVYQLQGGIIKYGQEEGNKHWKGKLFVFDDRLAVPISDKEEAEVIGQCHHCGTSCDTYHNCANMDCNDLFICCIDCLHKMKGCCQDACCEAPRVRAYDPSGGNKPFRRLSQEHLAKQAALN